MSRIKKSEFNEQKALGLVNAIDGAITGCYQDLSVAENSIQGSQATLIRSRFGDIRERLQSMRLKAQNLKRLFNDGK